MKNNNITLREIIEKVNIELERIYNKPVIKLEGYANYDTKNGREVIEIQDLSNIIREVTGVWGFSNNKLTLTFSSLPFVVNVKRKKSGMYDKYKHKDTITVTELYMAEEYNKYLDMTIGEIEQEEKTKQQHIQNEEQQRKQVEKENFIQTLKNHNLSFEQFKDLFYAYKTMDYDTEQEIKEALK